MPLIDSPAAVDGSYADYVTCLALYSGLILLSFSRNTFHSGNAIIVFPEGNVKLHVRPVDFPLKYFLMDTPPNMRIFFLTVTSYNLFFYLERSCIT